MSLGVAIIVTVCLLQSQIFMSHRRERESNKNHAQCITHTRRCRTSSCFRSAMCLHRECTHIHKYLYLYTISRYEMVNRASCHRNRIESNEQMYSKYSRFLKTALAIPFTCFSENSSVFSFGWLWFAWFYLKCICAHFTIRYNSVQ